MPPIRAAAVVVTALVASGCGRSQADDSARIRVTWTVDPSLECEADGPMMRIRSHAEDPLATPPPNDDDEEFDWVPCLDGVGLPMGVTAPLPLGRYEVRVAMALAVDGPLFAESDTAGANLDIESESFYDVSVVFGPPPTIPESVRAAEPELGTTP